MSIAGRCRASGLSTRAFLGSLLRSQLSIGASVLTCASLAVLICAGAVASPAVAQNDQTSQNIVRFAVSRMEAAIEQCAYDKWAIAKGDYDTSVGGYKALGLTPPAAPSYPIPCYEVKRAAEPKATPRRRIATEFDIRLYHRLRTGERPGSGEVEERADIGLGNRASPAQSQTVLYVGGDLAFTTTTNEYGDVPAFSSNGAGAGGHFGLRYYFLRNVFAGFEAGGIGTSIRGNNLDGAFTNYDWQAWQMGQLGVTFTPQGWVTPVTAYMGLGATQGRVRVGIDFRDFHESMSDILTGTVVRAGVEFNIKPNWTIGASYQHSWFSGTIGDDPVKTQLNTALVTVNYMITPRF